MVAAITLSVVCVAAAAALLYCEKISWRAGRVVTKSTASLAFVLVAAGLTAPTSYAHWVFAGLILGALGDVALLGASRRALGGGIALFLAGHLAYVAAFAEVGTVGTLPIAGGFVAAAIGVGAALVLWRPAGRLRGAVLAYVVVIVAMVVAALSTHQPLIVFGGVLFFASDLAVARQRFLAKSFINKCWGLPTYYGGQLLIAWSAIG